MAAISESTNIIGKKRKSDMSSGPSTKRARTGAAALVDTILANPDSYEVSSEDNVRQTILELARYAKSLEQAVPSGATVIKPKTREQLEEAAEKIRKAAVSGIKKQMKWKASCKTGTAKWSYDGICPDPEVFGVLLNLGGPPKFKQKKIAKSDFEDLIGSIDVSVRYDMLGITSQDVNVKWSETGEFKFSGSYGK